MYVTCSCRSDPYKYMCMDTRYSTHLNYVHVIVCTIGFFKIIRGKNEVGIEAGIYGGMPKN